MFFKTTASRRFYFILISAMMLASALVFGFRAAAENQDLGSSAASSTIATIKAALPAPPAGWTIRDETKIGQAAGPGRDRKPARSIRYVIRYRRAAGVREEQQRLDDAYAESSRRNGEAVKPQVDELIRQQTVVSIALKKAERRRNEAEQKRLNDELVENGRKMRLLHEEADRTVSREVEPYLVRNAEAAIAVAVNEETAEFPRDAQAFEYSGAAFAVRKDGERAGVTGWKEGTLLMLFGDWQRTGATRVRGTVRPDLSARRAQTISIAITGERKLAEQLLQAMDMKSILSLMSAE